MFFFFFNDTATTEIYTLSLHDALPIFQLLDGLLIERRLRARQQAERLDLGLVRQIGHDRAVGLETAQEKTEVKAFCRSEEHTSELQSLAYLVCRLLLEKKNYYPLIHRV